MNDPKPKPLILGGENHEGPLADISHLTEREKLHYRSKGMSAFGTFDYEQFKSDEEFELSLACALPYNWGYPEEETDANLLEYAAFYRSLYFHKKKYRVWKREVLDPMVKDLANYALDAPQHDASFLLELEKRKMECMDAYFSHSVTADENGNYPGGRWLRLCIKLLGYLVNEGSIHENKILAVNPRNISYPLSQWELDHFNNPTEESDKLHYGRKIYWHKAHRLYCHIRQHALHTWWD